MFQTSVTHKSHRSRQVCFARSWSPRIDVNYTTVLRIFLTAVLKGYSPFSTSWRDSLAVQQFHDKNPHEEAGKKLVKQSKTCRYNSSLLGFGVRLLPHFLIPDQNTNDVSVTWWRYSTWRHERAANLPPPPPPLKMWMKRERKKWPLTVKRDTSGVLARISSLRLFGELTQIKVDVTLLADGVVGGEDGWMMIRFTVCGSRRGERMTHSPSDVMFTPQQLGSAVARR